MRALALVGLVACSDLRELETGVCGNGVVEAGEDCDGKNARCIACGIRCDDQRRCDTYPGTVGYVCGADDFCHAPGGTLRDPDAFTVAASSLRITDIDRDRIGDLLIQSPTALEVRSGNFEGRPRTTTYLLAPISRGPASFAFLDEGPEASTPTLDVLLPTADGVAAYTSELGVLSPYPFPSLVGMDLGTPVHAHQIEPQVIGSVGTLPNSTALAFVVLDVSGGGMPGMVGGAPLCGADLTQFDPVRIDFYEISAGHQLVAATLAGATPSVCVLSVDKQGTSYAVTQLALAPVNPPALRRPLLAPLRSACPSLVIREASGAIAEYAGAVGTTTTCTLTAVRVQLAAPSDASPVGFTPLVPPRAGATIALALSSGVFAFDTTAGLTRIYEADRPIARVAPIDVDADGNLDLVALAHDVEGGAAVEDLDVLYRAPQGMPDSYVRYRFDTSGPVKKLLLADYDGNGNSDIAYVETSIHQGEERDDLVIAYNTGDQLLAGARQATFTSITSLIPAHVPDSNDQSNLVADLVVLHEQAGGTSVSIMHGSPQRTLIAFFDPGEPPNPQNQFRASVYRGAIAGNFTTEGAVGRDILAFDDVTTTNSTELWLSRGPTGGAAEQLLPYRAPQIARCAGAQLGEFCVDDARYVTWPAGDHDRVIGIDGFARAMTFDITAASGTPPTVTIEPWPMTLPPSAQPRRFDVLGLDAEPRIVIAYSLPGGRAGVELCEVAGGQPIMCTELGAAVAQLRGDPSMVCFDATVARITAVARFATAASPPDLILLCKGAAGTSLYDVTLTGPTVTAVHELRPIENATELHAGDINGDAIDDLITIDRSTAIPTIRVYTQCTSRDRVGCIGSGASP